MSATMIMIVLNEAQYTLGVGLCCTSLENSCQNGCKVILGEAQYFKWDEEQLQLRRSSLPGD